MQNQQCIRDAMEMWLTRTKFKNFCNEHNGLSVLVVSDNHLMDMYFNSLFSDCNCNFESVSSGMKTLAKIASQSYGLVILDEFIPDAEPFSLVNSITTLQPGLPVILTTAPMGAIKQKAKEMNIISLDKPFIFKSVIKTLKKALLFGDIHAQSSTITKQDSHMRTVHRSAPAGDTVLAG